ncbi:enoyl-CoA hydratase/isomerase domain-containing protein [Ditylenchus destructor]|nr:enoyl-CoA hydratase/isomerase domain-containing protein [Ditylenchus destructor]
MSSNKIITKRVDPIFYISINRPHKKNAIDAETYELLIAALNEANSVDDIFITVLTGVGDFFSAGNDFNTNDMHNINKSANETVELVHQFVNALIDHTKILVAQVNGPAIGIACTTLTLFDSVLASNHAYFYCPFTKLGILPEGTSTHTWPELMGHSQAARLLLFSEKVCAQEAKQLGLVNKVFLHQKFHQQSNEVIQEYASLMPKFSGFECAMKRFHCLVIFALFVVCTAEVDHKPTDKDHYKGEEHGAKYDHEQFLGKDKAAEFDELTPEKSKERLAKLVPKMDSNSDGSIEENELRDHINFMQKRYVNNDVERTWKNYKDDKIADGKLGWQDYRDMVYGPESQEISPDYAKMITRDERRWKVADYDSDGKLDRTEYGCFMHPEDCDHMRDIVVQETIEDIDKNKDGSVDLEEYIGDMYRPDDYPELNGKEPEWVNSEREMFKEHRDKNNDGKLDSDEMRDWIMPLGFDHADAEAKHLVGIADDNKDGKLSPEEIVAHYDTFVGSQATDYGEQLQKHDPAEL